MIVRGEAVVVIVSNKTLGGLRANGVGRRPQSDRLDRCIPSTCEYSLDLSREKGGCCDGWGGGEAKDVIKVKRSEGRCCCVWGAACSA